VRTSSVAAGAVALGIAVVALVTPTGATALPAVAAPPTCRGDRITVADLATGCAVATGTVVLPDGRRFAVPKAGTTVSALPGRPTTGTCRPRKAGAPGSRSASTRSGRGRPRPCGWSATTAKASSCTNKTFTKLGFRWTAPVRWSYNPAGQKVAGASSIRAGADAWTAATAVCGRKVTSSAAERLAAATTTQASGVTAAGGCVQPSGASVLGWGALPTGTLAVTCIWSRSGTAVKVDQRYTTRQQWNVATTCSGARFDLRGVATHEWGHAFGLGHTAQASGLVMKPASTTCETGQRVLGFGDVLGIDALY